MAAINDKVYARVHEKAKEHQLTDQELKALDTARNQLSSHGYLGGFTGASAAFLIGMRKKYKPLQLLALAGGGFLLGAQFGFVSGALAGVQTIKTLPNPQRLVSVIREVQMEQMNAKGMLPSQPHRPEPHPKAHMDAHMDDTFSSEDPALHGGYSTRPGSEFQTDRAVQSQQQNGWQTNTTEQQQPQQQQRPSWTRQAPSQPSKWDEIRSENLPNTAWAKIRQEAKTQGVDSKSIEQAKANRVAELQERQVGAGGFDDLPRTREEAEQRTTGRRNQWGDMAG
ncbi:hypothetical protein [Absidia glauca]|uniref:Uncharacterized protein n=1 Tax=Absidia glauca TaxID=4829 RepID=A0A163JLM3_ABSGL|nr:hypothetical protein [Absidia glauca]